MYMYIVGLYLVGKIKGENNEVFIPSCTSAQFCSFGSATPHHTMYWAVGHAPHHTMYWAVGHAPHHTMYWAVGHAPHHTMYWAVFHAPHHTMYWAVGHATLILEVTYAKNKETISAFHNPRNTSNNTQDYNQINKWNNNMQ